MPAGLSLGKIECPKCQHDRSRVIDSRPSEQGYYRRRQCLACQHRYVTEETYRPYAAKRGWPARQHNI